MKHGNMNSFWPKKRGINYTNVTSQGCVENFWRNCNDFINHGKKGGKGYRFNLGVMKAQYFTQKSYHQASGKELLCQMSFLLGPFLPWCGETIFRNLKLRVKVE